MSLKRRHHQRSLQPPPQKNNNNKKIAERFVVRHAFATSILCAKLREAQKTRKLKELIVRRKNLDTVLVGTLQDLLQSQKSWHFIALHIPLEKRASGMMLRLLKAVCLVDNGVPLRKVGTLSLVEPTPSIISWMGTVLGGGGNFYVTIQSLQIRSTFSLTTASAVALSEGFHSSFCSLERLDLTGSSFLDSEVAGVLGQGLSTCSSLQELCFSGCNLEDLEIRDLIEPLVSSNKPTNLRELTLDDNFCQQEGTLVVSKLLPTLQRLYLSNQNIWDNREYLDCLTTALSSTRDCRLVELDLSSNFLQDFHLESIVRALHTNTSLRDINLRNNRISNEGIRLLAKALPMLYHLQSMDLDQNPYDDIHPLEDGLASNVVMTSLQVKSTTARVLYYLALNKGGRIAKQPNYILLSLWPVTLERCVRCVADEQASMGIRPEDIVFDLLHGPVLLER